MHLFTNNQKDTCTYVLSILSVYIVSVLYIRILKKYWKYFPWGDSKVHVFLFNLSIPSLSKMPKVKFEYKSGFITITLSEHNERFLFQKCGSALNSFYSQCIGKKTLKSMKIKFQDGFGKFSHNFL